MSAKRMIAIAAGGVAFIALIILISVLYSKATQDVTEVVLPTGEETADPGGVFPSGGDGLADGLTRVEVTTETVQAVIATLSRPESYSRTIEVKNFWSGGSAVYSIEAYVLDGFVDLVINQSNLKKNIIVSEDSLYIWYEGDSNYYSGKTVSDRNIAILSDEYQMLPTYEDVLEMDRSEIVDAGYVEYNDEYCIYCRTGPSELGYLSDYYISIISVEKGLLIGMKIYDDETLIYEMNAGPCDFSVPDEELFTLPDGTNPVRASAAG